MDRAQADLETRIDRLAQWMYESSRLVVFTGAGISTASGLPDFRGPDGIWTRREKGLATPSRDFSSAEPNAAHMAIVELQNTGKMTFLISQNVDNLHLKSGIRPDVLAELHGNVTKLRCTGCGFLADNFGDGIPCPICGEKLVSSVVNFGQPMPRKEMDEAYRNSRRCHLFVVAGSSLVVMPAAEMPGLAARSGARLVIINQGATPLDGSAHLRFEEGTEIVLPRAVARLKQLMQSTG